MLKLHLIQFSLLSSWSSCSNKHVFKTCWVFTKLKGCNRTSIPFQSYFHMQNIMLLVFRSLCSIFLSRKKRVLLGNMNWVKSYKNFILRSLFHQRPVPKKGNTEKRNTSHQISNTFFFSYNIVLRTSSQMP